MIKKIKKYSVAAGFLLIIFLILILFASAYTPIRYGTVGVVTRFGGVTESVLRPGLNWRFPLIDQVVRYNTQKITYETSDNPNTSMANYTDYPVATTTQDGQQINIKYTVRFAVDPAKVQFVANNLGTEDDVVEKVVKTDSRIHIRNVPRSFTAEELYTEKISEAQEQIFTILNEKFEKNGLVLDEVGIREIRFDQDYVDAIEMKQIEKEKVAAEEYKAEQEKFKKEQRITQAQGEAESQRLQQSTLTNEMLEKLWIEKWDGQLPDYVGGEADMLLNMPK